MTFEVVLDGNIKGCPASLWATVPTWTLTPPQIDSSVQTHRIYISQNPFSSSLCSFLQQHRAKTPDQTCRPRGPQTPSPGWGQKWLWLWSSGLQYMCVHMHAKCNTAGKTFMKTAWYLLRFKTLFLRYLTSCCTLRLLYILSKSAQSRIFVSLQTRI